MIHARGMDEKQLEELLMRDLWKRVDEANRDIDRAYWENGNGLLATVAKGKDGE